MLKKITASITDTFEGLTLVFRLPDGAGEPNTVFVNGAASGFNAKVVDGIRLVYVVLPAGGTVAVEVNYN